jgi:hypothetical protein
MGIFPNYLNLFVWLVWAFALYVLLLRMDVKSGAALVATTATAHNQHFFQYVSQKTCFPSRLVVGISKTRLLLSLCARFNRHCSQAVVPFFFLN